MNKRAILVWILLILLTMAGSARDLDVKKIQKTAIDSVVKVIASNHQKFVTTGVVMDEGHVFTHSKIVRFPYRELYVVTSRGDKCIARTRGIDREHSLVLLQVTGRKLKPLKLARTAEVGDSVLLLGGFYQSFPAVFKGIISSLDHQALIVDSSIVPGSIGGAVLNSNGELLGIIRGKMGFTSPVMLNDQNLLFEINKEATTDLCLATPFHRLKTVFESIQTFGEVKKPWLGINFGSNGRPGIKVLDILPSSPAEKSGIRPGDRIVKLNRRAISSPAEFSRLFSTLLPETTVELEIIREDRGKTITVTLAESRPGALFESWIRKDPAGTLDSEENAALFPRPLDMEIFGAFRFPLFSQMMGLANELERLNLSVNRLGQVDLQDRSPLNLQELKKKILSLHRERQALFARLQDLLRDADRNLEMRIRELESRLENRSQSPHLLIKEKKKD